MAVSISVDTFEALNDVSEDDLYAQLGMAVSGVEPDGNAALLNLKSAKAAIGWPYFIQVGMDFFARWWPKLKTPVCAIYAEYTETNNDWIERVATAILAVVKIGSAAAILLATLVMRKGFDRACAV